MTDSYPLRVLIFVYALDPIVTLYKPFEQTREGQNTYRITFLYKRENLPIIKRMAKKYGIKIGDVYVVDDCVPNLNGIGYRNLNEAVLEDRN